MGKSIIYMAIFNSYVSLPEGKSHGKLPFIVDVPIKDGDFPLKNNFFLIPWNSHNDLPMISATARDGPSASAWRSRAGCCQPPPWGVVWKKWWKPTINIHKGMDQWWINGG